jgi:hypothetical protein
MTTATEIITQAFREANILPIGKSPTEAQFTEALPRLNNFISWLFGTELGEFMYDWPVAPNRTAPVAADFPLLPEDNSLRANQWPYAPNNARLLVNRASPTTVYLPFRPNPGALLGLVNVGSTTTFTINANGRLIEGSPTLALNMTETTTLRWIYREDLASWTRVTELALTDESFLAPEFDDLLICALAVRLAPRFGQEALPETTAIYAASLDKMRKRYAQTVPMTGTYDPTMETRQSYDGEYWGDEGALYGDGS